MPRMAIAIYDKASERRLFDITEEQLDQLAGVLEEEDERGHEYYVDAAVCDFLDGKIDAAVVEKLRAALPAGAANGAAPGAEAAGDDEEPPAIDESDEPDDESDDESDDEIATGIEIVWRSE